MKKIQRKLNICAIPNVQETNCDASTEWKDILENDLEQSNPFLAEPELQENYIFLYHSFVSNQVNKTEWIKYARYAYTTELNRQRNHVLSVDLQSNWKK